MQHQVAAVVSSGCAVPTARPPLALHEPGTYTMSVISLLPTSVPAIEKLEHKIFSEVKPAATSSLVMQASSLYTRKMPEHSPPDALHAHSVHLRLSTYLSYAMTCSLKAESLDDGHANTPGSS